MVHALLGTKIGQSQHFTGDGRRIPVTTITAGPCWITRITDSGSYKSLQLGFGCTSHMNKATEGHIKKAGIQEKPRFFREVRVREERDLGDLSLGSKITVGDVFAVGDRIRVTGVSKGKGFAGVVKRHHFKGGPRTHGQSDRERAPGSIGQTTTPGRVYKGKRMAGRMGSDQVTVSGLTVVAVNPQTNTVVIKGLVPGGRGGLLLIEKAR